MDIRIFKSLPEDAKQIRIEVFVKEQCFVQEFDELDSNATHLVGYLNDEAVATARILQNENGFLIGRIAVKKTFRKIGLGAKIICGAEEVIRNAEGHTIYINAQKQAVAFYEKQGYFPTGEIDEEEGCEHWMMIKNI